MNKKLEALKGEFLYDHQYDILTFKLKDRNYKMSIEFQDFVIDIDDKGFIIGIRIFDASRVSGLSKIALRNMKHGEFNASIQDNIVTVRFKFVAVLRNRIMPLFKETERFTQQFTAPLGKNQRMEDSEVIVAQAA